MALDVKVDISLIQPSGEQGFGFPLIVAVDSSANSGIAYAEYPVGTILTDIVTAGFAATTDVYKAIELMLKQENKPSVIAACLVTALDATALATLGKKGWRQLLIYGSGEAYTAAVTAATTYVGNSKNRKVYFPVVANKTALSQFANNDNVYACVHTDPLASAAVVGESTRRTVGSLTYKNLKVTGVAAMDVDDTEIAAIKTAGGYTLVSKAGDIVTSEGKVASGEYLDIIDCRDYIVDQIEYYTQKTLNNLDKVPYDDAGITLLEDVAESVLRTAWANGIILTGSDGAPVFSTSYALREDCEADDIAARKYIEGKFAFTLAGAVHEVEIKGEINIA